MAEKKYSFDWSKVLLIAAVVIMFGLLNKQCNDIKALESDHLKDSLKTTIKNQKRIADSLKLVANGHDSVRLEYITQWRTKIKTIIQHDSIPCDSVLPMVISTCDSITIADLEKKVVRLKRHRRWLLFGTGVLGGAVLINNR